MSQICPFRELAFKKSRENNIDINLDDGWCLYIPAQLKHVFGVLPRNVYYSNEIDDAFFAKIPPSYLFSGLKHNDLN